MTNRSSTLGLLALLVVAAGLMWFWLMAEGQEAGPGGSLGQRPGSTPGDADVRAGPEAGPGSVQPLAAEDGTPGTRADLFPTAPDLPDPGQAFAVGTVSYAYGSPAPEVEVTLWDVTGEDLDWFVTEDDGHFELFWDEPLLAGWSVATEPPSFGLDFDPEALTPAAYVHPSTHAPDQDPVEVQLVLSAAPILEGFITDEQTGEPLGLSEVLLLSSRPGWTEEFQEVWPEESGHYRASVVDVPCEQLIVLCIDDEHRAAAVGPIDLNPGEVRTLDFRLQQVRTLRGRVLDASTGLPVEDAEVMLLPVHPYLLEDDSWDTTFEDGTFELDVMSTPDAFLSIYVNSGDHMPAALRVLQPDAPLEVRLWPPVTVSGRVTDGGTGAGVGGADVTVALYSPMGALLDDFADTDVCDEDGTFRLLIERSVPDAARLVVHADGYLPASAPLAEQALKDGAAQIWAVAVELDAIP